MLDLRLIRKDPDLVRRSPAQPGRGYGALG